MSLDFMILNSLDKSHLGNHTSMSILITEYMCLNNNTNRKASDH